MLIRREIVDDVEAIDAVHAAAFARPGLVGAPPEVALVRDLRADAGWIPALSLVGLLWPHGPRLPLFW